VTQEPVSPGDAAVDREVAGRMARVDGSGDDLATASQLVRQLLGHVRNIDEFLARRSGPLPLEERHDHDA